MNRNINTHKMKHKKVLRLIILGMILSSLWMLRWNYYTYSVKPDTYYDKLALEYNALSKNFPSSFEGEGHLVKNLLRELNINQVSKNATIITESRLHQILKENCSSVSLESYRIKINDSWPILSMKQYKLYQAVNFIKANANPFKKRLSSPKLRSFEYIPRRSPHYIIFDSKKREIDRKEINRDLNREKQRRRQLGDDDLLEIPEVQKELRTTKFLVPNIIHFIWFGCKRFRIHNYMTLIGALKYQRPSLILFHTDCEPTNEYWQVFKDAAGPVLKIVKRSCPYTVWNRGVMVVEHQSDVARLQIMMEVGGIYLDTDSAVLKSVNSLREKEITLAESNFDALSNGIIFANRNAWFLRRWYWEYKYLEDDVWGVTSVHVPWALWMLFPKHVNVVKELICRPNFAELSYIFHELYDWHQTYIIHLYSRHLKKWDGKEERSLKELAVLNTTYGQIARHLIWGDERFRDIRDWIVACDIKKALLA